MTTNYIYSQSIFTSGLNLSQLQDEIDLRIQDLLGLNKFTNVVEAVFSRALDIAEYNMLSAVMSAHVPETITPLEKNGIVNLLQLHQSIIVYSEHVIGAFPWQSTRYSALSNGICLFSCDNGVKIEIKLGNQILGSITTISGGNYTFAVSLPSSSGLVQVQAIKTTNKTTIHALSIEWSL